MVDVVPMWISKAWQLWSRNYSFQLWHGLSYEIVSICNYNATYLYAIKWKKLNATILETN